MMDDELYRDVYLAELEDLMVDVLDTDVQADRAEAYHDLIAPFVTGAQGEWDGFSHLSSDEAFDRSVDGVLDAVETGRAEAEALLR